MRLTVPTPSQTRTAPRAQTTTPTGAYMAVFASKLAIAAGSVAKYW
jgi:hypothetical protein